MDINNLSPEIQYLIDPAKQFDQQKLQTLDKLTENMFSGKLSPQELQVINKIWETFKEDQTFWLNTDFILTNSTQEFTKFNTLTTLEGAIAKRWNTFPTQQKEGLKQYIIDLVIQQGSKADLTKQQSNSLSKCNCILIAILKYEWNTTWQSFIPDICAASKQNENLCKNNLKLLKMLSEEIFDYSKNTLTSQKKAEMKKNFETQFQEVFELCSFIAKTFVQNPQVVNHDLIYANLETLFSFMSWIPLGYIFFTDILDILTTILQYPNLRCATIKCLNEVILIPIDDQDPDKMKVQEKVFSLYQQTLQKVMTFIPCDISLQIERQKMRNNQNQIIEFENLCNQLCQYFTGYFQTHLYWIQDMINTCNSEQKLNLMEDIRKGLVYVLMFNELRDENIFKICAEFWLTFTEKLTNDPQATQASQNSILNLGGMMGANVTLQQNIYPQVLTNVRKIIISRMARPNEVLIKVEDNEVVKEEIKDTENQALYQTLRQLIINLSKLDWEDTKKIMSNKLEKQLDGSEWSWDNINSLSWAIGSISGTLPDQEEKSFLISAIRTLLNLCELRKGKQNKAVVASNIMYVVGQYPKFLKANWNFLKTVIKKLFEFMKETFPGVMEMAVNTFLTIATRCKDEFVKKQYPKDQNELRGQNTEIEPYIFELIRKIPEDTSMLENQNKYTFYEAIGHMISAEQNTEVQDVLINSTCQQMFEDLQSIINQAQSQGENILVQKDVIDRLLYIFKIQEKLAFSTGYCYAIVFTKIFDSIMNIYQFYSRKTSQELQMNGKNVLNFHTVRQMRNIKRQILKIMHTFLTHCTTDNAKCNQEFVITSLIIPFQNTALLDYININEDLRDPEVLQVYTIIFENMAQKIGSAGLVPQILKGIFDPTLPMIQTDFNSFPEVREKFFYFLKAVVNNAIEALFNIPPDQFKTMIDCVIWASKHQLNNLFMIGLEVLLFIFKNVNTNSQIANQFYSIYYMNVLKDLLDIITDGYHKSGFSVQYQILALMLQIVDTGLITVPIDPSNQGQMDNKTYIYEFLCNALSSAFNTINKQQTSQYIQKMFLTCSKPNEFKVCLRDYLINLQQYCNDNEHMFEDGNQPSSEQNNVNRQN